MVVPEQETGDPIQVGKLVKRTSMLAVFSLVFGILTFVPFLVLGGGGGACSFAFGVVSVILAILALRRMGREESLKGKPLALCGFVLGIVGILSIHYSNYVWAPAQSGKRQQIQELTEEMRALMRQIESYQVDHPIMPPSEPEIPAGQEGEIL